MITDIKKLTEKLQNSKNIAETLKSMGFRDATNDIHQIYVKVDDNNFPIKYYDDRIHKNGQITEDCIKVTDEQYQTLYNATETRYKVHKKDDGSSFLEEVPHTAEYIALQAQYETNMKNEQFLKATDWIVTKHRDQKEAGIETTLTDKDYQELLSKRQAARDAIIKD